MSQAIPSGQKRCSKCADVKAIEEFNVSRMMQDGHNALCRTCQLFLSKPKNRKERFAFYNKRRIEKTREYNRKYHAKNPWKVLEAGRRHRAHKYGADGSFTETQFQVLCDHYNNICLCCGEPKELTRDHVVPLVKGGSNDISNIQPLCKSCNSSKGVKSTDYREMEGLRC